MQHIDLFSGIGGFTVAGEIAGGFEPVLFVENNPFAQKNLRKNYPRVKIHSDIKLLTRLQMVKYGWDPDKPTIVTGGFPCQPFSNAGKQRGISDNRYLWPHMLRVIKHVKPKWVIGENVYGLVTMQKGKVFANICSDLKREGYQVWPFVLPAAGVNAPHRRARVWIVGYMPDNKEDAGRAGEKFTERLIAKDWGSDKCGLKWVLRESKSGTAYLALQVTESEELLLTPHTVDIHERSPEALKKRKKYRDGIGRSTVPPASLAEQIVSHSRTGSLTDMSAMLPTPRGADGKNVNVRPGSYYKNGVLKNPSGFNAELTNVISDLPAEKIIPTPTAKVEEKYVTRKKRKGHKWAISYLDAMIDYTGNHAKGKMLPTPNHGDGKTNDMGAKRKGTGRQVNLPTHVHDRLGRDKGMRIMPEFVEWMMGYPEGWTSLTAKAGKPQKSGLWRENWLDKAYELCWESLRTPDRTNRIKVLGNAIVPQVALQIFLTINEMENLIPEAKTPIQKNRLSGLDSLTLKGSPKASLPLAQYDIPSGKTKMNDKNGLGNSVDGEISLRFEEKGHTLYAYHPGTRKIFGTIELQPHPTRGWPWTIGKPSSYSGQLRYADTLEDAKERMQKFYDEYPFKAKPKPKKDKTKPSPAAIPQNTASPSEYDKNLEKYEAEIEEQAAKKLAEKTNPHGRNQRIEAMVNSREAHPSQYTDFEKTWIRTYSGSGGLGKYGATGEGLLYEFYTPEWLSEKMWELAKVYGFEGGTVLEPSCATGELVRFAPDHSKVVGFEINPVSAKIAQILYPGITVYNNYIETSFLTPPLFRSVGKGSWVTEKHGLFSLVMGNPPYGIWKNLYSGYFTGKEYKPFQTLEMVFFHWAGKLMHEGGLLIYLVSSNIMRNWTKYSVSKNELANMFEFVDAYRLPKVFAHSDVPTDIIIFRKKGKGKSQQPVIDGHAAQKARARVQWMEEKVRSLPVPTREEAKRNDTRSVLLYSGYVEEYLHGELREYIDKNAHKMPASPLTFQELTSQSTWFELHPEKTAGPEEPTTSIHFPVIIKADKQSSAAMLERNIQAIRSAHDTATDLELLKAKAKAIVIKQKLLKIKLLLGNK